MIHTLMYNHMILMWYRIFWAYIINHYDWYINDKDKSDSVINVQPYDINVISYILSIHY